MNDDPVYHQGRRGSHIRLASLNEDAIHVGNPSTTRHEDSNRYKRHLAGVVSRED